MKQLLKWQKSLTILIALLVFSTLSFGQSSIDKKALVTIGDEKITVGEFMRVYEKNNSLADDQSAESITDYLNLFINFKLKVAEAEAMQLDTLASFKNELKGYRAQLAKPYFIDESVNEALLQEAYQRKLSDVRASHILIMLDANASPEDTLAAYNKIVKIREEIMAGKDFAEAAVEYSDDPSAKDREAIPNQQRFRPGNKGDLGYFTVFNMVYPFENAAYNTAVGEVSQPVRTQFGYHLLKVTDKKEALGTALVAHIFIPVKMEATAEEVQEAQDKIDNIYQKIVDGMPFEEAVVAYSEDKGSAKNKGQLSKFTCNRVVPQFVLAAQSLNIDEISEPVRTLYGFHIIKLISRETPGAFEEEKPKLKERLAKDQRSHKSKEAVLQKIKADYKLKIYEKGKLAAFAAIDTSVLDKKFVADSVKGMIKPVMKIGNMKFNQDDFAGFVEQKQRIQENIDKDVYLQKLFDEFVDKNCLDYQDAHLEEKYPEFAELMQEYHDGILLFNLTDEKVWSKAVKDTVGLEKFFNKHRSDYMWGERVDATVYHIRNKDDVEKVKAIIEQNIDDGEIAQILDRDSITSTRIIPDTFERGDDKYVDQVEWVTGRLQQIDSDVEDRVTFVKIRKLRPPVAKQLDEARGLVTADYQTFLEEEWVKQLKEKYPVQVHEEVLSALLLEKAPK
ncbi:MAG: peptidyl-prolyl cis-trans isomerase [Bacteroidales bacterium]|nr:peptidyl-prolyl cis-trans isomerase [Bacteroidales bacterium]